MKMKSVIAGEYTAPPAAAHALLERFGAARGPSLSKT